MSAAAVLARVSFRLRHPRTTVRWRLTLLYGGLFLTCGAALLAITYTLVEHATLTTNSPVIEQAIAHHAFSQGPAPTNARSPNFFLKARGGSLPKVSLPAPLARLLKSKPGREAILTVGSQQRISDLNQLEDESIIALAIMAVICAALGWVVAGRVLRPLRTMTATTREITAANLNQRLALEGPRDELRQLADTIDELLERLEGAFDQQRRFVANASHELRTPLTTARALLEMVLSDPRATIQTFRTTCQQVLEEGEQQEQLIDALLSLAQGQRGVDRAELLDLAVVAAAVAQRHETEAAARGLELDVSFAPAPISGDRRLVERLVSNLLDNALRHNEPNGYVRLRVQTHADSSQLVIANGGPLVPADQVHRLLQPFQRLAPDRTAHSDGLGLGLSIVAAIATAHDATLEVEPGAYGGLTVEIRFPAAAPGEELEPPVALPAPAPDVLPVIRS